MKKTLMVLLVLSMMLSLTWGTVYAEQAYTEGLEKNVTFYLQTENGRTEISKLQPGNLVARYSVTNKYGTAAYDNFSVILAVYKDEKLVDIGASKKRLAAGGNIFYEPSVVIPEDYTNYTVKALILEDIYNAKPAYEAGEITDRSSACEMLSVSVGKAEGVKDEYRNKFVITLDEADIAAAAPEITVSEGASVVPASGETVDLSSPVEYTVTAENGASAKYVLEAIKTVSGGYSENFDSDSMTIGAAPSDWIITEVGGDKITVVNDPDEFGNKCLKIDDQSYNAGNSSAYIKFDKVEGAAVLEFKAKMTRTAAYEADKNDLKSSWMMMGCGNAGTGAQVGRIGISGESTSTKKVNIACSTMEKWTTTTSVDAGNVTIKTLDYAVEDKSADTGWHTYKMIYNKNNMIDYFIDNEYLGAYYRAKNSATSAEVTGIDWFGVLTSKRINQIYIDDISVTPYTSESVQEYSCDFENTTLSALRSKDKTGLYYWDFVTNNDAGGTISIETDKQNNSYLLLSDTSDKANGNSNVAAYWYFGTVSGPVEVNYRMMYPRDDETYTYSDLNNFSYIWTSVNGASAVYGTTSYTAAAKIGSQETSSNTSWNGVTLGDGTGNGERILKDKAGIQINGIISE